MASSDVQIVNSALIKIGEDSITSLTENRRAARAANRQYPIKRDELIREYRWNFAIKRVTLAAEVTGAEFGFTNRFAIPSDCLKVLGVFDEEELQQNYTSSVIPFKVEGGFILADDSSLPIFYMARITDVTLFDPMFSEVLAWSLAVDLAFHLTSGVKYVKAASEGFADAKRRAKRSDAIEGSPEIIQATEWEDSRYDQFPTRIGPVVV